jgi:AcrR family transcriptional regulator
VEDGPVNQTDESIRVPQQKRSIETRNRILAAAKVLFASKGFHGTNSKEIAAEAGVSIGSFYSYFKNKKALFIEVFREFESQRIMQILTSQAPAHDVVDANKREVVQNIIQSISNAHNSADFHREALAMHYADPDIETDYSNMQIDFFRHFSNYLQEMDHKLRVDDIEAAAVVVCMAVEGIIHSIKAFESHLPEERILSALSEMVYRFLFKASDVEQTPVTGR